MKGIDRFTIQFVFVHLYICDITMHASADMVDCKGGNSRAPGWV